MILHLVRQSPFSDRTASGLIERIQDKDGIVLLQDAVYLTQHSSLLTTMLQKCPRVYALENDMAARGLARSSAVNVISYEELVTLTLEFEHSLSW